MVKRTFDPLTGSADLFREAHPVKQKRGADDLQIIVMIRNDGGTRNTGSDTETHWHPLFSTSGCLSLNLFHSILMYCSHHFSPSHDRHRRRLHFRTSPYPQTRLRPPHRSAAPDSRPSVKSVTESSPNSGIMNEKQNTTVTHNSSAASSLLPVSSSCSERQAFILLRISFRSR